MPAYGLRYLKQRAVMWEATGEVDRDGNPIVSVPVEVRVRWTRKQQEVKDPFGNAVVFDSMALVDRSIPLHSIMWLAPDKNEDALEQWYGGDPGSAGLNDELVQVAEFDEIPDRTANKTLYKVYMNKFRDTLPEVQE